jgi:hypothetical protein
MEKKPTGRPRLYGTQSDKLDAFRKRQESAGYMRKEILVTKETWERVAAQASAHGVGAADAASGLLEFGLREFCAQQEKPLPAPISSAQETSQRSRSNFAAGNVVAARRPDLHVAALAERAVPAANPITQFFAKRKEKPNVEKSTAKQPGSVDSTEDEK